MKQMLDFLRDIRDNGVRKPNRTGTDTIGVIGRQYRFDLRKGFPLDVSRPIYRKGFILELLFFISGSTDNTILNAHDVHIWDKWEVKEDVMDERVLPGHERVVLFADLEHMTRDEAIKYLNSIGYQKAMELLEEKKIPTHAKVVRVKKGELGPVYGALWRQWHGRHGEIIDQLEIAIDTLKTNPFSRRIIVSAWDPSVLPDESMSPSQNAAEGRQCLAACHTFFKLSVLPHPEGSEKTTRGVLNLHMFQRSCDGPIGAAYNIASYSLLLAMIAQVTHLEAGEFIWTLDDAHIYVDQLGPELLDEQLSREDRLPTLPILWLNPEVENIEDFTLEDIKIVDYHPCQPQIKYPVAV